MGSEDIPKIDLEEGKLSGRIALDGVTWNVKGSPNNLQKRRAKLSLMSGSFREDNQGL